MRIPFQQLQEQCLRYGNQHAAVVIPTKQSSPVICYSNDPQNHAERVALNRVKSKGQCILCGGSGSLY